MKGTNADFSFYLEKPNKKVCVCVCAYVCKKTPRYKTTRDALVIINKGDFPLYKKSKKGGESCRLYNICIP